jgi:hypothetical protein
MEKKMKCGVKDSNLKGAKAWFATQIAFGAQLVYALSYNVNYYISYLDEK